MAPQIQASAEESERTRRLPAVRPGEGRLTEPTAAARLSRQQRRPMREIRAFRYLWPGQKMHYRNKSSAGLHLARIGRARPGGTKRRWRRSSAATAKPTAKCML